MFIFTQVLLAAKLTAAILSGSLAIISSLVDSVVDLASSVTIWATAKYARKRDPYVYPQGTFLKHYRYMRSRPYSIGQYVAVKINLVVQSGRCLLCLTIALLPQG